MPTLYSRLQTLLSTSTVLWLSEGKYPIQALRWPLWKLWGWQKMGSGYAQLCQQDAYEESYSDDWLMLDDLLCRYNTVAYRKPAGKPGKYKLVLAVRQGLWWVGIQTIIVET